MSECSLSGRGQGHVSNFCIVDLENFATASRRYKGDIHNSPVVGLFKAKFHYTGPTGHDRTRADPDGLCGRPARTQRSFSETQAAEKVRAGPVGPV